jgi:hypothetical protein
LVHASDSKESAEKEIKRLFPEYMELEKVIWTMKSLKLE